MVQAKVCNFIYVIIQNSECIDAYLIFTHLNLNLVVHIHRLAWKLLIWVGQKTGGLVNQLTVYRTGCNSHQLAFLGGFMHYILVNIRYSVNDTSTSIKSTFFTRSFFFISILLICIFSDMHLRLVTKVHSVASIFPVRLSVLAITLQFFLLFKTSIFLWCHLKR